MNRKLANRIRYCLDEWLTTAERRVFPFPWLAKKRHGPNSMPDFKSRAFSRSDEEFIAAYVALQEMHSERDTVTTPALRDLFAAMFRPTRRF